MTEIKIGPVYYAAWWEGLNDEQLYNLLSALGYEPRWAPVSKRAWWALKRVARRAKRFVRRFV